MSFCDTLRLVGSPETNKVMLGELTRLAQRALSVRPPAPRKAGTGALVYPFEPALAHLAACYHRTATRVLWDLYASQAQRLEPLYQDIREHAGRDQRPWAWDGAGISVSARNVGAFAAGERQIVGTVKNALIDGAAARGIRLHLAPDRPDIHVTVRMQDHDLLVSVDLVGSSLSQRGYRAAHGTAPLREHLAAVLLMLARHDARTEVLLDPMCGAGTICIESVLMGRAEPLWGSGRRPPYLDTPAFRDQDLPRGALFADTRPVAIGNELVPRTLDAARANARAAGVDVTWLRGDFRALDRERIHAACTRAGAAAMGPTGPRGPLGAMDHGLILCNPPYGRRLGDPGILDLYRDLGEWCGQFSGWRAGFLVANPEWERAFGRRARIRKPLENGPLRAYFYLYDL